MDKAYIMKQLKLLEEALVGRKLEYLADVATETLQYLESLNA